MPYNLYTTYTNADEAMSICSESCQAYGEHSVKQYICVELDIARNSSVEVNLMLVLLTEFL